MCEVEVNIPNESQLNRQTLPPFEKMVAGGKRAVALAHKDDCQTVEFQGYHFGDLERKVKCEYGIVPADGVVRLNYFACCLPFVTLSDDILSFYVEHDFSFDGGKEIRFCNKKSIGRKYVITYDYYTVVLDKEPVERKE